MRRGALFLVVSPFFNRIILIFGLVFEIGVDGAMLKEAARELKEEIDSRRYFPGCSDEINAIYPKFQCEFSDGWLQGFMRRYNLSFRTPNERKPSASQTLAQREVFLPFFLGVIFSDV